MDRRSFLACIAGTLVASRSLSTVLAKGLDAVTARGTTPSSPDRPNILCLVSEDNGTRLGCYGDTFAKTPNLDALAKEGVVFDACISMPVCAVSRFALITGCYPVTYSAHHMRSKSINWGDMKPYPIALRKAGYYTINMHKTDYNSNFNLRSLWSSATPKAPSNWAKRPAKMPFLAIYNNASSHESCVHGQTPRSVGPAQVTLPAYQPDYPELRADLARQYEMLHRMDAWCGEKLKALRKSPDAENTIVIYYSDNGGMTLRSKRTLHLSGTHVPLIVYFPPKWRHLAPKVAQAGRYTSPVNFVDIPATILSLCGLPTPHYMAGKAFAGTYQVAPRVYAYSSRDRMDERYDMSRSICDKDYLYIRHFRPDIPQIEPLLYAIKAKGYQAAFKAFKAGTLPDITAQYFVAKPIEELYAIKSDPDNVKNLAQDPAFAVIKERLSTALKAHMVVTRDQGLLPENAPHLANVSQLNDFAWFASSRDVSNLPILIQTLQDPSPYMRRWAAMGLAILGQEAKTAREPLKSALVHEENEPTRVEMAYAAIRILPDTEADTEAASFVQILVSELQKESLYAGNALARLPKELLIPHTETFKRVKKSSKRLKYECNIIQSILNQL